MPLIIFLYNKVLILFSFNFSWTIDIEKNPSSNDTDNNNTNISENIVIIILSVILLIGVFSLYKKLKDKKLHSEDLNDEELSKYLTLNKNKLCDINDPRIFFYKNLKKFPNLGEKDGIRYPIFQCIDINNKIILSINSNNKLEKFQIFDPNTNKFFYFDNQITYSTIEHYKCNAQIMMY